MNLEEIFASDGRDVFRAQCDFGAMASLAPTGAPAGVSLPLAVLFATSPDQIAQREMGLVNDRQSTVLASGADYRSAVAALTGTVRGPRADDCLTVARGEHAGAWTVTAATPAPGDEYEITVTWQALRSLGTAQLANP